MSRTGTAQPATGTLALARAVRLPSSIRRTIEINGRQTRWLRTLAPPTVAKRKSL